MQNKYTITNKDRKDAAAETLARIISHLLIVTIVVGFVGYRISIANDPTNDCNSVTCEIK